MNYYLDTEFFEYKKKPFFGKSISTIELISIGLVDETGREFYAISNEFDLKEVWNRHRPYTNPAMSGSGNKHYWHRENVLYPIYKELLYKERYAREYHSNLVEPFCYRTMKNLIKWNGQSNRDIANGICAFIYGDDCGGSGMSAIEMAMEYGVSDKSKEPVFYAYYFPLRLVCFL